MTSVKSVNAALRGQSMTPPSLQSPTWEHLPPLTLPRPLNYYPNLSSLTRKYLQNESTSLHLYFFCCNPHFYFYLNKPPNQFPTFMKNPHQYLFCTTSKNLHTMHCDVAWLFSLRIFDGSPLLFGKKGHHIQHPEPLKPTPVFLLTSLLKGHFILTAKFLSAKHWFYWQLSTT